MAKKILVIDDDVQFLEMMQMVLEDAGYEVGTCNDADAAHELIKEWQPSLVLLDLRMPGHTGWEILEALEIDPSVRRIPVIFTTAAEDEVRASEQRPDHWRFKSLFKPFGIDELLAEVDQTVGAP